MEYGEQVQAASLYLAAFQPNPHGRLSEVFADLLSCLISKGTLANLIKKGGRLATETMKPVREEWVKAEVAHADETGCRVGEKGPWLHVLSTPKPTSSHIDKKRGLE